MSQTAVILQARMGSSRLPGKMLYPVSSNGTLIEHMTQLVRQIRADSYVLATDDESGPAFSSRIVRDHMRVFEHSPSHDVLGRFAGAIVSLPSQPQTIVRVCGDSPLIDPRLVNWLLWIWDRRSDPEDWYWLGLPGLLEGVDILRAQTVLDFDEQMIADTPGREDFITLIKESKPGKAATLKTSIDTIEDYRILRRIL